MTKARRRSASTIGTSITSGGMGKNELSAKETPASAHHALGPWAWVIIHAYIARMTPGRDATLVLSFMANPEASFRLVAIGRGGVHCRGVLAAWGQFH